MIEITEASLQRIPKLFLEADLIAVATPLTIVFMKPSPTHKVETEVQIWKISRDVKQCKPPDLKLKGKKIQFTK